MSSDAEKKQFVRERRTWAKKFADAMRGIKYGVRGQSSFFVHFFAAIIVVLAGIALEVGRGDWCLLVFAISGVLVAEMINSAIERLVEAIHPEHDTRVGQALDIASAAVLLASITAVVIGGIVFLPKFL